MDIHHLTSPDQMPIFFCGPNVSEGPLPAFFYFALAGDESLTLDPYHQPVLPFIGKAIRVFSMTLPFHGPGFDKFQAMEVWMKHLSEGDAFLDIFFEKSLRAIDWLISIGIVDPNHIAIGGLSRGGFIATQLAAKEKRFRILLAFAPLTRFQILDEYGISPSLLLEKQIEAYDLLRQVPSLLHLEHTRIYIGNRDTRVGTDACYQFVRAWVEQTHELRARNCRIELFITPSIGFKGHGTASSVFQEGAYWVQKQLLGDL